MTVTAVPTWFGPDDAAQFGCVHLPEDGRVRGGVVICPPLAQEATRTQAALRALAVALAQRGLLALRFDYVGTGDSAGESTSAGAVDRWLDSIVVAHRFVAGLGVHDIGVIGLRSGALLASNALDRLPRLRALGLWAPVASGRRFIRQEQALHAVAVHPTAAADDSVIEGVGISFDVDLQRDLRRLQLRTPAATDTLHAAVFESAAAASVRTPPSADSAEDVTSWQVVPDGPDDGPSDVGSFAGRLPTTAVRMIADWTDAAMPPRPVDEPVIVAPRRVATVVTAHGAVRETLVTIDRSPAPGVVQAVVTEPVDAPDDAPSRPAAVLLNISVIGRTGPSRGWVTAARAAAARGTTAVRFDRHGLGESIDDTRGYVAKDFDSDAVHDVGVVARFVRPDDPGDVVLAGLCSGAWAAATVSRGLRPRRLVLMNMNMLAWTPSPMSAARARTEGVDWVLGPVAGPRPGPAARLRRTVQDRWRRLPLGLAARLGLIRVPGPLLDAIPDGTARVTLMQCREDFEEFVELGGLDAVERLSQRTTVELTAVYDADHGLVGRVGRDQMLSALVGQLTSD